jgi:CRP/FNR family transcriptional regulator, cyclic AMP receptor protein
MNIQTITFPAKKGLFATGSWFARLPADVQDELMIAGRTRHIEAGAMLFRQGDDPTGLHGLISGELHIIGSASNGHDTLLAIHRPGDWTGFLTSIDHGPHPLSALAATDCTTWSVPVQTVSRIFERDVATFRLLVAPETLVERRNYRWLIEMIIRPPMQRIAERLIDLGRWTHGERAGPVSPIEHVSQESLAAATNVSRQTMNAALGSLEELGLIKVGYGRIEILDSRSLEEFATCDLTKTGELSPARQLFRRTSHTET